MDSVVLPTLSLTPIGYAHTPFAEKVRAPRQAAAAKGVAGTIVLFPEYEHALDDLQGVERIWILYWFHLNEHAWRSKVLPPRSTKRRGVFSTRSPHRPNPIGLSCVRLDAVEGLVLRVLDVDMVDDTPVFDIKPYLPYADAFPDAGTGWLEAKDPILPYQVRWTSGARNMADWLERAHGVDMVRPVEEVLALGPEPHPYRRIKKDGDALRLSFKEWRIRFQVDGRAIVITGVASGYRHSQLFGPRADPALDVHRAFIEQFGP